MYSIIQVSNRRTLTTTVAVSCLRSRYFVSFCVSNRCSSLRGKFVLFLFSGFVSFSSFRFQVSDSLWVCDKNLNRSFNLIQLTVQLILSAALQRGGRERVCKYYKKLTIQCQQRFRDFAMEENRNVLSENAFILPELGSTDLKAQFPIIWPNEKYAHYVSFCSESKVSNNGRKRVFCRDHHVKVKWTVDVVDV